MKTNRLLPLVLTALLPLSALPATWTDGNGNEWTYQATDGSSVKITAVFGSAGRSVFPRACMNGGVPCGWGKA